MAEVTVSVDDEGATQGMGNVGERLAPSAEEVPPAADMPQALDDELPPLPPSLPSSEAPSVETWRRAAPVTQPIRPDEWVHDEEDDYWSTQSMIAVSGRMAVPRPKQLALEPPQRFRPVRRWQSMAALAVLAVVILATCIGALRAVGIANNLLHPHQPVPTFTTPTASPKVSPTAKPKSK